MAGVGAGPMPRRQVLCRGGGVRADELRRDAQFRRDYDGRVWVQSRAGEWWEVRLDAQVPGTLLLRDPQGFVHFITLNLQQVSPPPWRRIVLTWPGGLPAAPGVDASSRGSAAVALATTGAGRLTRPWGAVRAAPGAQIDLTDDYVVVALFGDGTWEKQVQNVQVRCRRHWRERSLWSTRCTPCRALWQSLMRLSPRGRAQVRDDDGLIVNARLTQEAFRDLISVMT